MSALKTWILFFVAAAFVAACSNDDSPTRPSQGNTIVQDSTGKKVVVDSDGNQRVVDTTYVTEKGETVAISGEDTIYVGSGTVLYYSSGVFCWTEGCEKDFAPASSSSSPAGNSSASTKPSSSSVKVSSSSAKSSSSSIPAVPPEVDKANLTLKDKRDNENYTLTLIGNTYWLNENLKYKPTSISYCDATVEIKVGEGPAAQTNKVNVCTQFGAYYNYNVAQAICPTGWRLPTMAEVDAALEAQPEEWWFLGGRFNLEDNPPTWNNGDNHQGYIWIQTSDGKNNLQVQHYGDFEHKYLNTGADKRAYNVRCVIESSKI